MDIKGRRYGKVNRNYVGDTMSLSGKYGANLGRIRFLKKMSERTIEDKVDNTDSAKTL